MLTPAPMLKPGPLTHARRRTPPGTRTTAGSSRTPNRTGANRTLTATNPTYRHRTGSVERQKRSAPARRRRAAAPRAARSRGRRTRRCGARSVPNSSTSAKTGTMRKKPTTTNSSPNVSAAAATIAAEQERCDHGTGEEVPERQPSLAVGQRPEPSLGEVLRPVPVPVAAVGFVAAGGAGASGALGPPQDRAASGGGRLLTCPSLALGGVRR